MRITSDEGIRSAIHLRSPGKCCSNARAGVKSAKNCRGTTHSFRLSTEASATPADPVSTSRACDPPKAVDRFQSVCNMQYDLAPGGWDPRCARRGDAMVTTNNKMADTDEKIFIGRGEQPVWLTLGLANRHGLVTGATGTGKTVSLQMMAEGFARAGVPVFAADIKGDLSGISEVGEAKDFIVKRAAEMGLKFQPDQFSTVFWDVFGEQGHPVRATVTEMGPLLLSRMMDLNDVQEGVLNIAVRVADEQGLLLLSLKDLRAILSVIAEHAADLTTQYGNVSKQTVGTIQRQLLLLENQGGARFFGEPALALKDFMRTDSAGPVMVNILVSDRMMHNLSLYATVLHC